jgi:hypothetical protein
VADICSHQRTIRDVTPTTLGCSGVRSMDKQYLFINQIQKLSKVSYDTAFSGAAERCVYRTQQRMCAIVANRAFAHPVHDIREREASVDVVDDQ